MIDSLNEKEIVKQFKNPTDLKGGISKLEYWLSELNFPDYQQQIKFLRNLQELRSTGTGHRKGKGYEKAAGVFFRYSYFDMLLQTLAVSCISAFDGGEPHYKNGYTHPRSSENAVQKCIHAGRSPLF